MADQLAPAELALEDLCTEEAESDELEGTQTGLLTFVALFLLSVSYGAAVTLCKVGTDAPFQGGTPCSRAGRPNRGRASAGRTVPHARRPPGEVGPGCCPEDTAAGFPRPQERRAALPPPSCERPRGCQLDPGPKEGADQPPGGQSQGPSDQHTGAESPQLSPKVEGNSGPTYHSPTPPHFGASPRRASVPSTERPGLGVGADHPRLLPGPWARAHTDSD